MKSWYYADINHEQQGPVSSSELKQLLKIDQVSFQSLVWSEGMEKWLPLSDIFSELLDDLEHNLLNNPQIIENKIISDAAKPDFSSKSLYTRKPFISDTKNVSENKNISEDKLISDNYSPSDNITVSDKIRVSDNNFQSEKLVVSEQNNLSENKLISENNAVPDNNIRSENHSVVKYDSLSESDKDYSKYQPNDISNNSIKTENKNFSIPENTVPKKASPFDNLLQEIPREVFTEKNNKPLKQGIPNIEVENEPSSEIYSSLQKGRFFDNNDELDNQETQQSSSLYAAPVHSAISSKEKIQFNNNVNQSNEIIAASVLKRFSAFSLDILFVYILNEIIFKIISFAIRGFYPYADVAWSISLPLITVIYFIFLESYISGTFGKHIIGIKSINEDGKKLSLLQSFKWHLWLILYSITVRLAFISGLLGDWISNLRGFFLSYDDVILGGILFLIGAFIAKESPKPGLHDILAKVRVVDRWALTEFSERQNAKLNTISIIILFLSGVIFLLNIAIYLL